MGQIQSSISSLNPQRVHVYSQGWFTHPKTGSHVDVGYNSSDPAVVRRQVLACAEIVAPAVLNVCVDYYWNQDKETEAYTQVLMKESERQGTQFSIMIDKGAVGHAANPWQELSGLVAYLRSTYFKSPAYAKIGGKFMLWEFGVSAVKGIDMLVFEKDNPDIAVFSENSGTNSYAWPNGFAPSSPQAYMQSYLKRKDSVMVPCLWKGFDDHSMTNPKESCWGGPARLMAPGSTGWDLWNALVGLIKGSGRKFAEIGIATLNDFDERTRIEPFILQELAADLNNSATTLLGCN